MPLNIELTARYVGERRDDGLWYIVDANTGAQVAADGYARLADATEAAEGLES